MKALHRMWVGALVVGLAALMPTCAAAQDTPVPNTSAQAPRPDTPAEIPPRDPEPARETLRITIGEAIRIALAHNLGIRVERLTYEKSVKDVAIARAAFDPLFATNYTMSKFRSPTIDFLSGITAGSTVAVNPFTSQVFDFGLSGLVPVGTTYSVTASDRRGDNPESGFFGFNPRNSTSVRGDITQPLLKGLGYDSNLADLRIARNSEDSADLGFRRLRDITIGQVHTAYWNLVFSYKDLDVKELSLEEARNLLEINRQKVAVGSAKRIDIINAEAEIETQKSGIIEAKNMLRKAQEDLLDLLNYAAILRERGQLDPFAPLYDGIQVVPATELDFQAYPVDLPDAIRTALAYREDLEQSRLDLASAELELRRRENQVLPSLNLTGSWTQNGLDENIGNSVDRLGSGRFYEWSLGLNFEYPLGNRDQASRLEKTKADLEIAKLNLETATNGIILEVTQLARDIQSRYQQVLTNRAVARLRREQFAGEQQRLRVGSSTSYQVQQVQNDLLEGESQLLRAQVDYELAIIAFEQAVGIIGRQIEAP